MGSFVIEVPILTFNRQYPQLPQLKWWGVRAWCPTVLRVGSNKSLSLSHTLSLSLFLALSRYLSLSTCLYLILSRKRSPPLVVAVFSSFPHFSELWEQRSSFLFQTVVNAQCFPEAIAMLPFGCGYAPTFLFKDLRGQRALTWIVFIYCASGTIMATMYSPP